MNYLSHVGLILLKEGTICFLSSVLKREVPHQMSPFGFVKHIHDRYVDPTSFGGDVKGCLFQVEPRTTGVSLIRATGTSSLSPCESVAQWQIRILYGPSYKPQVKNQ